MSNPSYRKVRAPYTSLYIRVAVVTAGKESKDLGGLEARAARTLRTMDSTPSEAIDAAAWRHHAEELHRLVEDLLAERGSLRQVWLVWDCADLAGVFATEAAAQAFRADRVDQMVTDYGRNQSWADAITVTPARISADAAPNGADRS